MSQDFITEGWQRFCRDKIISPAHCTLHTAYCTLYTAHCTLHTAQFTDNWTRTIAHCTAHCTTMHYTTHWTLQTAHRILYTAQWKMHTSHWNLHIAHYTTFATIGCKLIMLSTNSWTSWFVYHRTTHIANNYLLPPLHQKGLFWFKRNVLMHWMQPKISPCTCKVLF